MGHSKVTTPIKIDNQCIINILTDTVKQRRDKAMDIRLFVKDHIHQSQFYLYGRLGKDYRVYYMTNHHSSSHYKEIVVYIN